MNLDLVHRLIQQGKFEGALRRLKASHKTSADLPEADVLSAFLHERTGDHAAALDLANRLLKAACVQDLHASLLEETIGNTLVEAGDRETARRHLQRAVALAARAKNLPRMCWAQLRLWSLIAEDDGPDSVVPLLADLRVNVIRAANPTITAALHLWVAQFEGKSGRVSSADWHNQIATTLLEGNPNVWLEAIAEINNVTISVMSSRYQQAITHGIRAIELAEQSGVAVSRRASLGNIGLVYLLTGKFEKAKSYVTLSQEALTTAGDNTQSMVETLANACLMQGDLSGCERYLLKIEAALRRPSDQCLYAFRYAHLTRANMLLAQGKFDRALECAEETIALAEKVRDPRLLPLARVAKGEALVALGCPSAAIDEISATRGDLVSGDVDVYGNYLRLCAATASATNDNAAALRFVTQAQRLYSVLNHGIGTAQLERFSQTTLSRVQISESRTSTPEVNSARELLSSVAVMLSFADSATVVASELRHILESTDSIVPGSWNTSSPNEHSVTLHGGSSIDEVSATFAPTDCAGGVAAITDAAAVLAAADAVRMHRARTRAEAATWPAISAAANDGVILRGEMAALMTLAARVARARVTVLVTGESGTGKEILARAIHDYSPRATRPFIPFNCTAISRDLLEGQMFGHRRGAFTGAERDNPGIVRAAADGTLFLDEIGELSLDLQPKLLRFLESGEILPVGENQPVTVNVRVIAATNLDLEQRVREGSFREDLFYRLNVVNLKVPPLRERRDEIPALAEHFVAQAAIEYDKGRVEISPDALEYLLLYRWPGNVRQLANELRRVVVMVERNATIIPEDLAAFITTGTIKPAPAKPADPAEIVLRIDQPLNSAVEQLERAMLAYAIKHTGGRLEETASALGLSRKGLYLKRQRLGLMS